MSKVKLEDFIKENGNHILTATIYLSKKRAYELFKQGFDIGIVEYGDEFRKAEDRHFTDEYYTARLKFYLDVEGRRRYER